MGKLQINGAAGLTGLLSAHGGISLNASTAQETPEFILGIKAFADGGNIIWQSASNVSVGFASSVPWSGITGKPSTFTPASHTHSQYASIAAHNDLTASGNEFTFASNAFSGAMYINYRTAGGSNGNITRYKFQNGSGSNTAIECSYMYGTAQAADYATSAGNADTVDGHHFHWSGQSGQPSWLWGGNDSTNMYVYNPSNFSVNYANSAGQANSVYGRYTGNGGNQIPSYIGSNTTRFNMMRNFGSSDIGGYMDCILMNNYSWSDVPYATGLGITKTNGYPRAIIANGPKDKWAYATELVTTYNYSWWCVPLSGGTMSGNLAINTHGNTMTIGSLNSAWCHFQSSADIPFYFNRRVFVDGCLGIYQMNSQGCGSSFPSNPAKGQIFFKI